MWPTRCLVTCCSENRFGPYRQFGAVKFPSVIRHNEGDPRLFSGHSLMEVQVSAVTANAPVEILPTPDKAKAPPMSQATIRSEKIGDGIWCIGGIRHGSVAVGFRDFVAVVEAPLNEKRAIAVINEVYRLIPNKPIRYLVNSHHHFDHSGGIRTFVAEGAKVVTHQNNRDFYERVGIARAQDTRARPAVSAQPAQLPRIGHRAGPVQRQVHPSATERGSSTSIRCHS